MRRCTPTPAIFTTSCRETTGRTRRRRGGMRARGWDRRTGRRLRRRWDKPDTHDCVTQKCVTEMETGHWISGAGPAVAGGCCSVDLAVEEVVLLLAGRTVAADCAGDERGDAERDENGRQITAQIRQMGDKIMHMREAHFSLPPTGTPELAFRFPSCGRGGSHIRRLS